MNDQMKAMIQGITEVLRAAKGDLALSVDEDPEASEHALDAARAARTAEADRRAAEAGAVNRAARCVCGCSGINHLDVMTDAELTGAPRIPCAQTGCPCDDLAYVRTEP